MPTTRRCYYEVLEVLKTSSQEEIKKSYRRLALMYHPDRNNGDPDAEQEFKACAEAYEILSDPQRRARYDQYGHEGLRSAGGGVDFSGMGVDDIFSMFNDIFGGGVGGQRAGNRSAATRGYDLETETEITLEDVFNGTTRDVEFKRLDTCETCEGSGCKPGSQPKTCDTCSGSGRVQQAGLGGMFRMVVGCPECRGRGTIITDKCGDCRGSGRVSIKRKLSVKIPPGIQDGQAVRVQGEGEPPAVENASMGAGRRGDLHVVIRVQQHETLERDGDDLLIAQPIAFAQAALGATLNIESLEDELELKIEPGTQHGDIFRLPGEGLPNLRSGRRGDLVVIVQLVVPRKLSEDQRTLLKEYARNEELDVGDQSRSLWEKIRGKVTGK